MTVYGTPDPYTQASPTLPDSLATDAEVAAAVGTLVTDVTTLQSDVTDVETDVTALTTSVGSLTDNVTVYRKEADQDITATNINFVAVTGMVHAMLLDAYYDVETVILYSANSASLDFKFRFTYPTLDDATGSQGLYIATDSTFIQRNGSATQWPAAGQEPNCGTAAALDHVRIAQGRLFIANTGSEGNLQLEFAKASASSGTVRFLAGSRMVVRRLV